MIVRAIAAAAVLSALLVGAVIQHRMLLGASQEVIMAARGFDPRELLMGHYVVLQLQPNELRVADGAQLQTGAPVWVRLARGGELGDWRIVSVGGAPPASAPGEIAARARIANVYGVTDEAGTISSFVQLDWGVDRVYLAQADAKRVEDAIFPREDDPPPVNAILALTSEGRFMFKGVMLGDERIAPQ
jgi:hypothetical protein